MFSSPISVGDTVRVKAARRFDIFFEVVEIASSGVVRAVNRERGSEVQYRAEALEKIDLGAPASVADPVETTEAQAEVTAQHQRPDPVPSQFLHDRTAIHPRQGESIDSVLKRFKKATQKSGILADARKHEHYEKPSVRRRVKAIRARIRRSREDYA